MSLQRNRIAVGLTAALVGASAGHARADYPVAGVEPSERPAGAPVVERVSKGDAWYATALTGIDKPYPASFKFLEDQGNWYTPFNHPGMYGRYDIRGWHAGD